MTIVRGQSAAMEAERAGVPMGRWAGRASVAGRAVWALVGCLVGIVGTVLALVLLAPAPAQTEPTPPVASGIVVSIDDATLAQVIADGLAQANTPFHTSNIQVSILLGNLVDISGDATYSIVPAQRLSVTGQVSAQDGHLHMHLIRASIGGLNLPAPLVGVLEQSINNQLVRLGGMLVLGGTRYVVTGVSTSDGILSLTLGAH